jgi:TRAP-type C4-dicarboxylate transport system substrate-binding protein
MSPASNSPSSLLSSTRRKIILGSASLPLIGSSSLAWSQTANTTLKISHQFPGGTIDKGDFRDRLCRKFAVEVEKRSNGTMKFDIYPGSSLMKTNAQFGAVRKGALDITLFPLPYAGGEVAEANIGLMPALVTSYEQAAKWKTAEVGRMLTKILEDKGVVILSWIWQAGGVASRNKPLINPEDAKGMKIRGGSREFDMMLKAAGASVLSLPSNEIYAAMQTGAMDAAFTSSTSFISFKLEEIAKSFTSAQKKSYWFMLEPLLMSKKIFDALPKEQRDLLMTVGAELEVFGTAAAIEDDKMAATIYAQAGAKVYELDDSNIAKWKEIASKTAWKDFAERNATCAAMMKAAESLT